LGTEIVSPTRWRFTAYDVLLVVAMTVAAFVLRRRGLPDAGCGTTTLHLRSALRR
jgi:hypothetical protein